MPWAKHYPNILHQPPDLCFTLDHEKGIVSTPTFQAGNLGHWTSSPSLWTSDLECDGMGMHTLGSAAGAPHSPQAPRPPCFPLHDHQGLSSHLPPHPLLFSTPHFIMKPQLFQQSQDVWTESGFSGSAHCLKFIRLQTGLVGLYMNASMAVGVRRVFSCGGVKWHQLGRDRWSLSDGSLCSDFER